MSLQNVDVRATKIQDMFSWFLDVFNHLSKDNYQHSDWIPTLSGGTGSPTVRGKYTRWGQQLDFTVVITGTYSTSGAYISNLPITAKEYGIVTVYSIGSGLIGYGYIDNDTKSAYIPDMSVANDTVVIQGKYRVSGI